MSNTEKTAKADSSASQINAEQNQYEKTRIEILWEIFKEIPQRYSAFFAGCAFIVSCIACLFSYCQMRNSGISANAAQRSAASAEKSIEFAKQSARISNRAYVHAITATIDTSDKKIPKIKVYIVNNGQTPAYKVKTIGMFAIDTIQCRDKLIFENIKGLNSIGIIPQKSPFWSIHPISENWKLGELKRAFKMERFLHVYGWITYETIFSEQCSTTYSLSFDSQRNGFTVCPENNHDYKSDTN